MSLYSSSCVQPRPYHIVVFDFWPFYANISRVPQVLFDCFKQCKPFPHGIPLTTMVEFLDMVWDEEGLE